MWSLPRLGGATFSGIPRYRFPIDSLDKQVRLLEEVGVKTRTGRTVAADEFRALRRDNLAVFLATGLMKPYRLDVHGDLRVC